MSIYLAGGGLISLGQFAACVAAFGSMQFMAESVVDLFARQKGMADFVGDYYDFFDYGAEEEEGEPYGGLRDGIELRGVSFRYPQGGRDALSDVSFHIRKGERVVIVGENGSDKTTLSKVLAGIYRPMGGHVLYDGKDASCYGRTVFIRNFRWCSRILPGIGLRCGKISVSVWSPKSITTIA